MGLPASVARVPRRSARESVPESGTSSAATSPAETPQFQGAVPDMWDSYNALLLGPDLERIRKLLARYELFKFSLPVPGDVVECGVFKGTGLLYWLKLLAIFAPGSTKRVIGFDTFGSQPDRLCLFEREPFTQFIANADAQSVAPERIRQAARAAGVEDRMELVIGDVTRTAPDYLAANPGLRISLLHLDLDTYHGTKAALKILYPRVVKGGVIVIDEYANPEWGESMAVDEYFNDRQVQLRTLAFSRTPTAFVIK
jgi:Macrocin-O-methyltransferase (TylF)